MSAMGEGVAGIAIAVALAASISLPAFAADRDKDGLSDSFESTWGVTSPDKRDTDGDGVVDSAEDNDQDRLGNLAEQRYGTDPGAADTDGDGTADGAEDKNGDGKSNARQQDQRRLPAGLRPSLTRARADIPKWDSSCRAKSRSSRLVRCGFGPPASSTRIVLMGDSHAMVLLPAIKRAAELNGWRLVTLIKGACSPVLGTRNSEQHLLDKGASCRDWRSKALAWLRQHPPDLVVLTHSDRYGLRSGSGTLIPRLQRPPIWKQGLKRTLASMPPSAKVLVLGDVPHNDRNPTWCLERHRYNMAACASQRQPLAERSVEVALREAAAAMGAQHKTLAGKICTYDPCPLVHGDVLIWRDKSHLTKTFVNRLMPSVHNVLARALKN